MRIVILLVQARTQCLLREVQGKILMIEIYHVLIRSLNSLTCNFVFYCDSLVESAFSSVSWEYFILRLPASQG